MNFLLTIKKVIVAGILGLVAFTGSHKTEAPVVAVEAPAKTVGAFNPTGGGTYRLQSSVGISNVTIPLSSFKEPISNIPYTMAYLNTSVAYGTLDPQQPTLSEFISFTGITQNSDGTALLTGVTRGLSRSYPYTASSTVFAKAHAGQSIFILSNSPNFQAEYATKQNNEVISGYWNFSNAPAGATATATNQYATLAQVNATAAQGAATSTETNGGIVELGTLAEQANSFDGGALKPTVLQTKNSTSTCQVIGSYNIVASSTTGKIDRNCIDQTATYTFVASTTLTATTSIAASNVNNRALILNNVPYAFPSTQGLANQFLQNNGSGVLSWATSTPLIFATTTDAGFLGPTSFVVSSTTIPGGTLSTNRILHGKFFIRIHSVSTTVKSINIRYGNTSCASLSATPDANADTTFNGVLDFWIQGANSTSAQDCSAIYTSGGPNNSFITGTTPYTGINMTNQGTASIDSTVDQAFQITAQENALDGLNVYNGYIELLK